MRDLIDDYLSHHKITLSVTEDTRQMYDKIIANSGGTDQDLEVHFRKALKGLLVEKIEAMEALRKQLEE